MAAASGSVIEGECEAVAEVEERPKGKVADGDRNGGALHVASAPLEGTKEHMEVVEVRACVWRVAIVGVNVTPPTLQRHLDALTFCGSAINDLELQLSNAKSLYRRTYAECKVHLEETRRRLGACIPKSQPFIEVWRRARQVYTSFPHVHCVTCSVCVSVCARVCMCLCVCVCVVVGVGVVGSGGVE